MEIQKASVIQTGKYKKLVLGIIFDTIGVLSYLVPGVAEYIDIIWAPIAGILMTKLYPGRVGKVAGVIAFLEEIIPFTDIIPSFTITWFYTYYIAKEE
jgi:hypothetical protein